MLADFQKQVDTGRSDSVVNAWDEPYFAGLLKAKTHDLNAGVSSFVPGGSYFPFLVTMLELSEDNIYHNVSCMDRWMPKVILEV